MGAVLAGDMAPTCQALRSPLLGMRELAIFQFPRTPFIRRNRIIERSLVFRWPDLPAAQSFFSPMGLS